MPLNALVMVAVLITTLLVGGCTKERPSYSSLLKKNAAYYAAIAEACNVLLSETNHANDIISLRGDDKSLPKALWELHATRIEVVNHVRVQTQTNEISYVTVFFGEGRPDFVIGWSMDDSRKGNCLWKLAITKRGPATVVFSTPCAIATNRVHGIVN